MAVQKIYDLYRVREGKLIDTVNDFNMFLDRTSKKLLEDLFDNNQVSFYEKAQRYGLYMKIKNLRMDFSDEDVLTMKYKSFYEGIITEETTFQKGEGAKRCLEVLELMKADVMSAAVYQNLIPAKNFEKSFSNLIKAVRRFAEI